MRHKCPHCGEALYTSIRKAFDTSERDEMERIIDLVKAKSMRSQGKTLQSIGDEFGVSREAVRQLLEKYK